MESDTKTTPSLVTFTNIQTATIACVVIALTFKLVRKLTSGEKPPPPGPWGFPILGHLPLLGKEPNVTFMKMREKFGDIFQIRMGSWPTVVVNGKRAIRESLKDSGDDFSGRPRFVSSAIISNGESLSLGQFNEKWRIYHKLAARAISEFTNVKKNPIEEMVQEEVDILAASFMSHALDSFNPHDAICLSVTSIIYQICYGKKENLRENKDFITFLKNTGEFSNFLSTGNPVDTMPWLRYFMPWKIQKFADLIRGLQAFRKRKVEECKETFSYDHLRHIADGLIAANKKQMIHSEERIMEIIDAIFGAASETVSSTFRWAVLLMAAHPDIQKRVQAELDEIVGDGRRPGLQDRGRLMYTEAVLHEVNRYISLEPLALPHSTTVDTHLGGYSIKKDTVVFFNLYSMSHDKDAWGDPDVFRPERFLDDSGQINTSLMEEFLPFSAGRRKCMGETLAKAEMFLFLSGLLQRCSITKPHGLSKCNLEARVGLTRECSPYMVQARIRK